MNNTTCDGCGATADEVYCGGCYNERLRSEDKLRGKVEWLEDVAEERRQRYLSEMRRRREAQDSADAAEAKIEAVRCRLHDKVRDCRRAMRDKAFVAQNMDNAVVYLDHVLDMLHGIQSFALTPAPAPRQWTKEPPTEPGWYWVRYEGAPGCISGIRPVDFDPRDTSGIQFSKYFGAQWYSTPITPPGGEDE